MEGGTKLRLEGKGMFAGLEEVHRSGKGKVRVRLVTDSGETLNGLVDVLTMEFTSD